MGERAILFLKMRDGYSFNEDLASRVRKNIERECSLKHVPEIVLEVKDIPHSNGLQRRCGPRPRGAQGLAPQGQNKLNEKLFGNSQTQTAQEECCDWKHLSSILRRQENTKEHMAYITLEKGIKHEKTLDRENGRRIPESQKH
ncbi:TTF-type domain-containing protein [Trichonephila clavipes]|nr:TTF-type domain-containing protein [Trichonephila clavipes]